MKSHGRLFAHVWGMLFTLIFASGCGKDHKSWNSFPVEIYADSAITANTEDQDDLVEAMRYWEANAGKSLFNFRGTWTGALPPYSGDPANPSSMAGNVVFFQNPWPFKSTIAAQTVVHSEDNDIDSAMIMVNPTTRFCAAECSNNPGRTSLRRTFAHELGHFLGLDHVADTQNIMNPEIQSGGTLEGMTLDIEMLRKVTEGED